MNIDEERTEEMSKIDFKTAEDLNTRRQLNDHNMTETGSTDRSAKKEVVKYNAKPKERFCNILHVYAIAHLKGKVKNQAIAFLIIGLLEMLKICLGPP